MASAYEDEILRALRRITRAIDLHSRRLASRFGLTVPQLVCLRSIAADAGRTPSSLAREVHLSQATVTGILDRLAKQGLVTRERTRADRRMVSLYLTDEAHTLLQEAPSPLQEAFVRRLEALPDENQVMMLTVLRQMVRMMQAEGLDAAPLLTTGPAAAEADEVGGLLESDLEPG